MKSQENSSHKVPVRIKWTNVHEIAWQNVKYQINISSITEGILREQKAQHSECKAHSHISNYIISWTLRG